MDVEILGNRFVNCGNGFTICAHSFCPLFIDRVHGVQIRSYGFPHPVNVFIMWPSRGSIKESPEIVSTHDDFFFRFFISFSIHLSLSLLSSLSFSFSLIKLLFYATLYNVQSLALILKQLYSFLLLWCLCFPACDQQCKFYTKMCCG